MKKKLFLIAIIILCTSTVSGEEYSGYDPGEINPIRDIRDIVGETEIIVDEGAVETVLGDVSSEFIAYASVHNRTAVYYYDTVISDKIFVNGEEVYQGYIINGECEIRSEVFIRYATILINRVKGWPKYYYLTSESELKIGDTSHNTNYDIEGFAYHTDEWDKKRREYNEYMDEKRRDDSYISYEDYLCSPKGRSKNVYWPGEKVLLRCKAVGSETVTCNGINMKCLGNGEFSGEMILEKSSSVYPIELTFKSDKGTDVVNIIVDGRDEYWGFHRRR